MTHQPYEDWLIEGSGSLVGSPDRPLKPEEAIALHAHLQECLECHRLALALAAVETDLREAPQLAPEPGFADRWQARHAVEQARLHRRQSLFVLGFFITGAILLFGSILFVGLPYLRSSDTVLWIYLYEFARFFSMVNTLLGLIMVVFRTVLVAMPWGVWVLLMSLVSLLLVIWVASLRYVSKQRRVMV